MYNRVAPRDFFNEANYLKCFGQLALHKLEMRKGSDLYGFDEDFYMKHGIELDQCPMSGALVENSGLFYKERTGERLDLMRPLNSREAWPLYIEGPDDTIYVFDDDGALTEEFIEYLKS